MATFRQHLEDQKWLFMEKGLQHVWNFWHQVAEATTQGIFVVGAGMIGDIELDAVADPGLTAAVTSTVNPSGQLDEAGSSMVEYGSGAVPRTPPSNFRS